MPLTRAQVILSAVRQEVERRRALLDAGSTDLYTVTITLRFAEGAETIRSVGWHEERDFKQKVASARP